MFLNSLTYMHVWYGPMALNENKIVVLYCILITDKCTAETDFKSKPSNLSNRVCSFLSLARLMTILV